MESEAFDQGPNLVVLSYNHVLKVKSNVEVSYIEYYFMLYLLCVSRNVGPTYKSDVYESMFKCEIIS